MSSLFAMGMPMKKRSRRAKAKGPIGSPKDHHQNIGTALDAGDHLTARKHAFSLIRSIDKGAGMSATPGEPDQDDAMPGGSGIPSAQAGPSLARLAMMNRRQP